MSRIHSTSRLHNIPTERVDSFKYEDRPSLGCETNPHEGRYCIDVMIESLFKDRTVSWVRIVNGINKYVTETSQEIPTANAELFITAGKSVAKAELKPKSVVNSSIDVPFRERKWMDIDPQPFDHVDRYTCRTPHFHMHSHSTVHRRHVFLGSRSPRAQDELRAKNIQSSTGHVSPCALQYTEHQHKFSLTYFSCVIVVLFSEPRLVVHASTYPP